MHRKRDVTPSRSRALLLGVTAAAATPLLLISTAAASPAGAAFGPLIGHRHPQPCPAPQSLIKGTKFATHRLATGVTLKQGTAHDTDVEGRHGTVNLAILEIHTTDHNLSFAPLDRHLAQRTPLSRLAAGHPSLVAATNTGYFDFINQAPLGPVFDNGVVASLGVQHQEVVGLTASNTVESGQVWLDGSVKAGHTTQSLAGINFLPTQRGLSAYTNGWGTQTVPFTRNGDSVGVVVRNGRVAQTASRLRLHPTTGTLLVGSTSGTQRFLRSLKRGEKVSISSRIATNASKPMVQGYNVGTRLIKQPGKVDTSLGCDERDSQAARTGVGYTAGGKKLIIAVVADHVGSSMHGLDHKEMSRVMVDLGAAHAWEWDGSGSSEVVARMPGSTRVSVRNYCADGQQRPMPVGFGIFSKH